MLGLIAMLFGLLEAAQNTGNFLQYSQKVGAIEKESPYLAGIESVEMPTPPPNYHRFPISRIAGHPGVGPTDLKMIKYWEMIADWAGAAYCSQESLVTWSCGQHCEGATAGTKVLLYFSISSWEAVGWVGIQEKGVDEDDRPKSYVIISYRGSEGLTNWIQNLKFARADVPWDPSGDCGTTCGKVHLGFLETYQASEDLVIPMVQELLKKHPGFTLLITGHSLGGAVATLAASKLNRMLDPSQEVRVVTFEAPRVGDGQFSTLLNAAYAPHPGSFIRITNKGDPVVHLPPSWIYFSHNTQEVYQNYDGITYNCDPVNGEDPTCADSNYIATDISAHLVAWTVQFGWPCPVGAIHYPPLAPTPNPDCKIVVS